MELSLDQFIGQTIDGNKLKEIIGEMPLVKFMNNTDVHYGMNYVTGFNKDILPFNPSSKCCKEFM